MSYASLPTVTLPRLRAITTGQHPSFLDVSLNLLSAHASDEVPHSLVHSLRRASPSRTMALYGDDTWLRLHPRHLWTRVRMAFMIALHLEKKKKKKRTEKKKIMFAVC